MANNCPNCDHKIDTESNYKCPKCDYKFWQSREAFEKNKKNPAKEVMAEKRVKITSPKDNFLVEALISYQFRIFLAKCFISGAAFIILGIILQQLVDKSSVHSTWSVLIGVLVGLLFLIIVGYIVGLERLYEAISESKKYPHQRKQLDFIVNGDDHKQKNAETIKCPFCAETIKGDAIVCRYCHHRLNKISLWKYIAIVGVLVVAAIPFPSTSTSTFSIPYTTQYIQSSEIELGESQINQQGANGQGLTKTKLVSPIFGYIARKSDNIRYSIQKTTETTQAPLSKIIANGTKKYQYMWCSNGSYRYYTNDQFKNALTGFTHKSPDNCAENKAGHMTQLSDVAPQAPTTIYKPVPAYSPTRTTTHCSDDFLGGVTCTTY